MRCFIMTHLKILGYFCVIICLGVALMISACMELLQHAGYKYYPCLQLGMVTLPVWLYSLVVNIQYPPALVLPS